MKINELRIENWVELRGEYLQVFSIENKSTATQSKVELQLDSDILNKHIKGVNIRSVEPIPLTEEILLKCGFEIECKINGYYSHIDISGLFVLRDSILSYNMDSNFIAETIALHQLQNLFYELTGKELEVDLQKLC